MVDPRRIFGNAAEQDAAAFLKSLGMVIVDRQYRNRFGEIDLIAKDGEEFVMVEVKARHDHEFGYPEEAVTKSKLRKIAMVGEAFMNDYPNALWRIDVLAIEYDQVPPKITHIIGV
ncbi:MAG: YraN family protein [Patescibacteria group bacterium]|jgi:putative endonuclease